VAVSPDVDAVLADLDRSLDRGPSAAELYRRWEEQQWRVTGIDFAADRDDWRALDDDRRRYLRWALARFFTGEESVTVSLVPFVDACTDPEHRRLLTTQLVDEARHALLFDRVFAEVLGVGAGSAAARLDVAASEVTPGYRQLFDDALGAATARLRTDRSTDALVRGVTLYHVVVEGTVALAGQRHILDWLRREPVLGAFREAFTHVTRDESRHVAIGVLMLRGAIATDPAHADAVRETVLGALPALLATLEPPGGDERYYEAFGFTQTAVAEWALDSLRRKLSAVGVAIDGL
jgi:ribonucleoside-diphosphate reductase beta chain